MQDISADKPRAKNSTYWPQGDARPALDNDSTGQQGPLIQVSYAMTITFDDYDCNDNNQYDGGTIVREPVETESADQSIKSFVQNTMHAMSTLAKDSIGVHIQDNSVFFARDDDVLRVKANNSADALMFSSSIATALAFGALLRKLHKANHQKALADILNDAYYSSQIFTTSCKSKRLIKKHCEVSGWVEMAVLDVEKTTDDVSLKWWLIMNVCASASYYHDMLKKYANI